MPDTLPLAGICVVEIGHSLAAPYAGMVLAGLGASVIKVESPEGDHARDWGPPFIEGASALFHAVNHAKTGISVNLSEPRDVVRLRRLIIDKADVVLQNLKGGSVEKYGIGPELLARKETLIYCNLGAFGDTGPLRDKPGYDPLVQALSGQMSFLGLPEEPNSRIPVAINDMGTGLWATIGVLAALHRRHTTGKGGVVSASLYETALSWAGVQIADYLASGVLPGRWGSGTAGIVPHQAFLCADVPIMVAAGNDRLFRRLCEVLNRPDLAEDARFRTNGGRVANRETLIEQLLASFATRPAEDWLTLLENAGVPTGPLQTLDQVMEHGQTKALDIIQTTSDGAVSFVGLPIRFGGVRPRVTGPAPKLGEHNGLLDSPQDQQ